MVGIYKVTYYKDEIQWTCDYLGTETERVLNRAYRRDAAWAPYTRYQVIVDSQDPALAFYRALNLIEEFIKNEY
jgi:hypothetical protein